MTMTQFSEDIKKGLNYLESALNSETVVCSDEMVTDANGMIDTLNTLESKKCATWGTTTMNKVDETIDTIRNTVAEMQTKYEEFTKPLTDLFSDSKE